jgi:hypothetical protein
VEDIYQEVAALFVKRINEVFESEATLETEFKKNFGVLEFSRTDHWAGIIWSILRNAWLEAGPAVKSEPTGYDKLKILRCAHPLLDYNLFTQVLLNLQGYTGMAYMVGDAVKQIERIKAEWPKEYKLDPFAPKAKQMKTAVSDEEKAYNNTLSTLRSLHLIAQFTPQVSFRVSPKGKTPAFADSRNISMLGVGSDKYLKTLPNLKPYYIVWQPGMTPRMAIPVVAVKGDGFDYSFQADGIPYHFRSKSGGEILQEALFARKIMYEIFRDVDITSETCIMVPRMNSVLIVTEQYGESLKKTFARLKKWWPVLELVEGQRA